MTERNRVLPTGEIVAVPLRGAWTGNRGGVLHRGHEIVRAYAGRGWITCALSFRGMRMAQWQPGHYTPLFFHDEAVALAAGHRPCAFCRRPDFRAFQTAFAAGNDLEPVSAPQTDAVLHAERRAGRTGCPGATCPTVPSSCSTTGRPWCWATASCRGPPRATPPPPPVPPAGRSPCSPRPRPYGRWRPATGRRPRPDAEPGAAAVVRRASRPSKLPLSATGEGHWRLSTSRLPLTRRRPRRLPRTATAPPGRFPAQRGGKVAAPEHQQASPYAPAPPAGFPHTTAPPAGSSHGTATQQPSPYGDGEGRWRLSTSRLPLTRRDAQREPLTRETPSSLPRTGVGGRSLVPERHQASPHTPATPAGFPARAGNPASFPAQRRGKVTGARAPAGFPSHAGALAAAPAGPAPAATYAPGRRSTPGMREVTAAHGRAGVDTRCHPSPGGQHVQPAHAGPR